MKRRLTFKSTIVILLFVIFIVGFIRQELTMKRIQNDIVASQQELKKLKDEKFKLQTELDNTPDQDYLEKLVRERLGMVKQGEKVVNSQKEN